MQRTSADQLSIFEGREARDEGLELVEKHNATWTQRVKESIYYLPSGWIGTGEDIRRRWFRLVGESPKHPNAWGAVVNAAVREGWLQRTGRILQALGKPSHARNVLEYRRT